MRPIDKVKQQDFQYIMKKARGYGAKDGEINNPYRAVKLASQKYRESYKKGNNNAQG